MPNEEKGESLSYFLNEHNLNPYTVSPIFQDSHRKWRIDSFQKLNQSVKTPYLDLSQAMPRSK